MKKIYVLFLSLIIFCSSLSAITSDTLKVQKAIILGAEITGPIMGVINSDLLSYEGYVSYRLSHKFYLTAETGYSEFKYEQYNYRYNSQGAFLRLGTDINLLKPETKPGNHYVGIGFKYGLSIFSQETPWLKYDNYWGTSESSKSQSTITGHFIQVSGGIKAELFNNILIGWTVRANLLLFHGGGKENRPVYIPGMGNADANFKPTIVFHIAWMIPVGKN